MAAGDVLDDDASLVCERRRESLQWLNENYYDEFTEVYRAAKCRTKAIMVKNSSGKEVEDKTRTNVAMPDMAVMIRRGTARLTAQPPQINYTCQNQDVADKLTTWSYMQYDRSEEAPVQSLHIQQAKTFGFSVTKSFWNCIEMNQTRRFRRADLVDRAKAMKLKGSSDDEIQAAVTALGPQMSAQEIQQDIMSNGPELKTKVPVKRYEGPATKFVFIGDHFPEPGFKNLDQDCSWQVEQYFENETWIKYWLEQTYTDENGKEVPVFDKKVAADVVSDTSANETVMREPIEGLRQQFWAATGQSDPALRRQPRLVNGKRFLIYECHEMIDGEMWIMWVANEKYLLGKMPYPWNLNGRSAYTSLVLLPDLISGIGDSTPRLGRFLYRMHNAAVGQRTDLISNILRRSVFVQGPDTLSDPIERAQFRVYTVKNIKDIQIPQEAEVPASAWETENQILKMMGLLDPNLTNQESGSNLNPGTGKTATAATLAQKSSDAMLSYEIANYNTYLRSLCEKKLWMLQQTLQDPITMPNKYQRTTGLSMGENFAHTQDTQNGSFTPSELQKQGITLDPMEIQDDIEVEPEVGSTLSVDDEFKRMNAQNMYQLAVSAPTIWNVREAALEYAKTIRGVDPKKVVLPIPQPTPPEPKLAVSMVIKFDDLPADVKSQMLSAVGLTPAAGDFAAQDAMKAVTAAGDAADAAGKMLETAGTVQDAGGASAPVQ